MFYGKYQVAIWSLFLVFGAGTATSWLLREVLGLRGWVGFVGWLVTILIAGRIAYVDWRRDWGS